MPAKLHIVVHPAAAGAKLLIVELLGPTETVKAARNRERLVPFSNVPLHGRVHIHALGSGRVQSPVPQQRAPVDSKHLIVQDEAASGRIERTSRLARFNFIWHANSSANLGSQLCIANLSQHLARAAHFNHT